MARTELSTDQVEQPINTAALSKWVGAIPDDVVREMDQIAPMLRKLGYDPFGNPPNYGTPDKEVVESSKHVKPGPDIREDRKKEMEKIAAQRRNGGAQPAEGFNPALNRRMPRRRPGGE